MPAPETLGLPIGGPLLWLGLAAWILFRVAMRILRRLKLLCMIIWKLD